MGAVSCGLSRFPVFLQWGVEVLFVGTRVERGFFVLPVLVYEAVSLPLCGFDLGLHYFGCPMEV